MPFPDPFHRFRPHPWHGLPVGPDPPGLVHAYVEITPFDSVKYEVDKVSGYLRVDRPQPFSSHPPALYGFVPRTFCGPRVAERSAVERADGDPLDVCVLSERQIDRAEVLVTARVIGGIRTLDRGEADDKIVAVVGNDEFWRTTTDIAHVPEVLVTRLRHYFATYKLQPGHEAPVEVREVYGADEARDVVRAAVADYRDEYGD